jgi:OmpA-OmpF porin, OOP family
MKTSLLFISIACATWLTGCATQTSRTATDGAIHRQLLTYEAQQARIKTLNDTGRHRIASYPLAKAQCWLDVSMHEYTRNDRSSFPQSALEESIKITQELQAGSTSASAQQTPLLSDAAKLRPDLWEAAAQVKKHSGWRCAEQLTACAEVQLVHAAHEAKQLHWRYVQPYLQLAEDGLGQALQAAGSCPGTPITTPAKP